MADEIRYLKNIQSGREIYSRNSTHRARTAIEMAYRQTSTPRDRSTQPFAASCLSTFGTLPPCALRSVISALQTYIQGTALHSSETMPRSSDFVLQSALHLLSHSDCILTILSDVTKISSRLSTNILQPPNLTLSLE